MTQTPPETHRLLICSVGGTPEPVVTAIRHWRPVRIIFLCSDQTCRFVEGILAAAAATTEQGRKPISPGCTDIFPVADPQDIEQTLRDLRRLDQPVQSWQQRGENYDIVVDFTGGTKVMSAALALLARRWKCDFAYVGGRQRGKDGVGVVVDGAEQPISHFNPWDTLGYQTVEEVVAVFNHGGYAAAAHLLGSALKNASAPHVKRELATLNAVIEAYAAWDSFDHNAAMKRFDDALKNRNDLLTIFPHDTSSLIACLERHRDRVAKLAEQKEPTGLWIQDLFQNAQRRAAEGRYDDAVARLYRVIEALAQIRLRDEHGFVETKNIPLDQLPQALRDEWRSRANENNTIAVGLQDAYRLLGELGDPLAEMFTDCRLDDPEKSPLVARNSSILAHGFQPVGKSVFDQLRKATRKLVDNVTPPADTPCQSTWRLPGPDPG